METTELVNKGLQDFIFVSKYARWIPEEKRRETWEETVNRVCSMHLQKYDFLSNEDKNKIIWAFDMVKQKKVLPSMRSMQFGGAAILAHEPRIYNCCTRHLDSIRAFSELAYLMLCGCGTGIGLSKKYLGRLPKLVGGDDKTGSVITYVIEDTIEGWADSLEALLGCYFKNNAYSGRRIIFDYSKIRRKGARLKTGGGQAPGYKPLKLAHQRIKAHLDKIIEEDGVSVMRPIHAYDTLMHFADAVLSGGVRRTASSVVFDRDDAEMMTAKTFFNVDKWRDSYDADTDIHHMKLWVHQKSYDVAIDSCTYDNLMDTAQISWQYIEPQRARSNNSVLLLRDRVTKEQFQEIIQHTRQFGEPGFVWANHEDTLFNPCYEIAFIPVTENGECGVQFCNLVTLNGDKIESAEDLMRCVEAQAIIATLQAGYTSFPYLSQTSEQLTKEEALLGCSMTGVLSSKILQDGTLLKEAVSEIERQNITWAKKINIKQAARTTALKPEGTGSLVIGVQTPGCHPAHSSYFFKRVQVTQGDDIYEFFKQHNPHMCEKSVWNTHGTDDVITFPIKAKEGSVVKDDLSAIQHLNIVRMLQKQWVIPGTTSQNKKNITNNVSCTIIVKKEEWHQVISHIYEHRHTYAAVSLLDYYGDKIYAQAPFEKITSASEFNKYCSLLDNYKEVDYSKLYEVKDKTTHNAEVACGNGSCLVA